MVMEESAGITQLTTLRRIEELKASGKTGFSMTAAEVEADAAFSHLARDDTGMWQICLNRDCILNGL